jgi:hypothetical protein
MNATESCRPLPTQHLQLMSVPFRQVHRLACCEALKGAISAGDAHSAAACSGAAAVLSAVAGTDEQTENLPRFAAMQPARGKCARQAHLPPIPALLAGHIFKCEAAGRAAGSADERLAAATAADLAGRSQHSEPWWLKS